MHCEKKWNLIWNLRTIIDFEQVEILKLRAKEGISKVLIAKELKVSRDTIYKYLQELGIKSKLQYYYADTAK